MLAALTLPRVPIFRFDSETMYILSEPSDGNRYLLTIINVYCPRSDPDRPERKAFKLDFYKALEERAGALVEDNKWEQACYNSKSSKLIHHVRNLNTICSLARNALI